MLKAMRSSFHHLKWILWGIVGIFVAFIFVSWGMGGLGGPGSANSDAARVGGHTISAVDFDRQYKQTEERYRQMYRQQWSPNLIKALDLPRQVLNSMVERQMMVEDARKAGLRVTDAELAEKIQSNPSFQKNGEFVGTAAYTNVLLSNGYTVQQFEHEYRDDLLIEKYNRLIASGLYISDDAVLAQYAKDNEKAKIEYVLVSPDHFPPPAAATDAELLDHFNHNKEKFRQPERRKLKYLIVDEAHLREKMKPSPAEVQAYFTAHRSEFPTTERVHAQHILIKLDQNATAEKDAAAKKKAEELLARAKKGEDFAALAKQYSEDPGSKDKGGDLGAFARGAMVKPFEEAAFSARPGDIIGPVKTDFGYHVIKLLEKLPAGQQTLEEATPRITMMLSQNLLKDAADKKMQKLSAAVGKNSSDEELRKLADDVVTFNSTDWVTAKDVIPGLGYAPDVLKASFALNKNEVRTTPISTPRGPVIVKVVDIKAPGLPDFSEVKSRVAADYRSIKTSQAALDSARPLADDLKKGGTLDALAKKFSVQVQTPAEFSRGAGVPALGNAPALVDEVFKAPLLQPQGPVWAGPRGVVFFKVDSKTEVNPALFSAQKERIREQMRQQEAQKIIDSLLTREKAQEKITINDEVLKRYSQG